MQLNDSTEPQNELELELPLSAVFRLVAEWSCAPKGGRIEPDIHGLGAEYLSLSPVVKDDQYLFAHVNKNGRNVLRVTINRGRYTGGPQENYEIDMDTIATTPLTIKARRL